MGGSSEGVAFAWDFARPNGFRESPAPRSRGFTAACVAWRSCCLLFPMGHMSSPNFLLADLLGLGHLRRLMELVQLLLERAYLRGYTSRRAGAACPRRLFASNQAVLTAK